MPKEEREIIKEQGRIKERTREETRETNKPKKIMRTKEREKKSIKNE